MTEANSPNPDLSDVTSASPEITFEEAIATTQALLEQMAQGNLSEADIEAAIATLVSTENGARGFFVTYSTDDRELADHPSPAVYRALQSSPDIVAELLVKNLAMSSAMAVTHRRNDNEVMAQGADRVRSRMMRLIDQLELPQILERAQKLHETTATGVGEYRAFLERWNYDAEQRQVIQEALLPIIHSL